MWLDEHRRGYIGFLQTSPEKEDLEKVDWVCKGGVDVQISVSPDNSLRQFFVHFQYEYLRFLSLLCRGQPLRFALEWHCTIWNLRALADEFVRGGGGSVELL